MCSRVGQTRQPLLASFLFEYHDIFGKEFFSASNTRVREKTTTKVTSYLVLEKIALPL